MECQKIVKFSNDHDVIGKNCFAYALGLDVYRGEVPQSADIAAWLGDLLAEDPSGDIIIYFSADKLPCHMGLMKGEDVESKWKDSHVFLHEIFATPYGQAVKKYRVTDINQLKLNWEDEVDWMKRS